MPQVANRVDILAAAWSNDAFRRVVLTGAHEQVVVMTIPPGGDIGEEVHASTDQVLAFVDGHGEAQLDGESAAVGPNDLVFVRAGTRHNFVNTGDVPLRLDHDLRAARARRRHGPRDEGRGRRRRALIRGPLHGGPGDSESSTRGDPRLSRPWPPETAHGFSRRPRLKRRRSAQYSVDDRDARQADPPRPRLRPPLVHPGVHADRRQHVALCADDPRVRHDPLERRGQRARHVVPPPDDPAVGRRRRPRRSARCPLGDDRAERHPDGVDAGPRPRRRQRRDAPAAQSRRQPDDRDPHPGRGLDDPEDRPEGPAPDGDGHLQPDAPGVVRGRVRVPWPDRRRARRPVVRARRRHRLLRGGHDHDPVPALGAAGRPRARRRSPDVPRTHRRAARGVWPRSPGTARSGAR